MRFLVVIETQKVKSYLFASPIMRETRGGSVLLDRMNRVKTEAFLDKEFDAGAYEVIYLAGGSGRVLFATEADARRFRAGLLERYRDRTGNAQVAVEIVSRRNGELFAEWIRRGIGISQQRKLGRTEAAPMVNGRWIRPCSSCGREPAEATLQEWGLHHICRTCGVKRREIREHLYRKIKPTKNRTEALGTAKDLRARYGPRFIFTTIAELAEEDRVTTFLPQNFEDIGNASSPGNYMGFIYADGNQMGEVIKALPERYKQDRSLKQAYRAFSDIVDCATREAAVEAVLEEVSIEKWRDDEGTRYQFIPAEFIMAGGDDLMLAVPAHNVLDTAINFIEKFQIKTKGLQTTYVDVGLLESPFAPEGLTTSAGVVIAHTHYPASDLMDLAADLMRRAKKKVANQPKNEQTGSLDFIVLSEAGSEPIKERREAEYTPQLDDHHRVHLTERPCTVAQATSLLHQIRCLKASDAPRSKLKALYAALFQPRMQAQFEALHIKERLRATGDLWDGSPLQSLFASLNRFPFRENADGNWTTPLSEIIELFDYVQLRPEQGGTPCRNYAHEGHAT